MLEFSVPSRQLRKIRSIYTLDMVVLSELVEEARLRYIETNRPHVVVHLTDSVSAFLFICLY